MAKLKKVMTATSASDVRRLALEFAIRSSAIGDSAGVIKAAAAYLNFLEGASLLPGQ